MCYANSSTSVNIDLAKRYNKSIPEVISEKPIFYASGFAHPIWRIVTNDAAIQAMKWGLIPHWFKSLDTNEIANKTLNARIETLQERSSFKHLWNRQHCLVPSTGFFEWQKQGANREPYLIKVKDKELFSIAGLYDTWLNPLTQTFEQTFTLVTCEANELMSEIHNVKKRMPLILSEDQEVGWLSGNVHWDLSQRFPSDQMEAIPIEKRLVFSNDPNVPEIHKEFVPLSKRQTNLFD
jgi:putative SOS response-associated peptidase YedK